MIQIISAPDNVVAFRAIGEVTKEDYQNTVIPAVEKLVKQIHEINFLLVFDNDIKNFTMDSLMEDEMVELKNFSKWNRAAIVSDSKKVIDSTNGFTHSTPGEFRGFKKKDFNKALNWVEGNS